MDFLLSRYRNMTALLVVILAQLVLLAWQVKTGQDVSLLRLWAVSAVTPLAGVMEFVRENTVGVLQNYIVLVNVRNENQQLKEELGKTRLENRFLRTELETADRARALQAFQQRTMSTTLPARIIGTGTGANSRVVFVDQGTRAGVMRGMAAVTPDGIVGKVLASWPTASQVLLITDKTFAAGVISEKHRVHGTVKGQGQSKVIVEHVQNEEKVEPGEMFYTSGDDRIFPKGMPVGRVTVVREGSTIKEIYLVPSGLSAGLEEVLIVLEGVHGTIPDPQSTPPSREVYLLPPPPDTSSTKPAPGSAPGAAVSSAPSPNKPEVLMTDADRLREQYKRIGEAQKHTWGEGMGRVPNFNLNPDAAQAPPAARPTPAPQQSAPVPDRSAAPSNPLRQVPPPTPQAQ